MDNFIDEQRNADMLDALADIAHEQEQAMRESEQSEWDGIDYSYSYPWNNPCLNNIMMM